jgi:protein-S-isoprenylcysteine O-methyltransferase Ste14
MKGDDMGRVISFFYGIIAHIGFLLVFLYLIGFLGNVAVPKSIDSGQTGPFGQALLFNLMLLGIFAIQHSVMARQGFKRWWTKTVPPYIERTTYVLISDLLLVLLLWQWRPMTGVIWDVGHTLGRLALWGLFGVGWLMIVLASFMTGHFDLSGTRQVYLHLQGRDYSPIKFKADGLYKYIRHPLLLGWIIAFWSTPHMTVGHLVFAVGTTIYILIAIRIEERDLVRFHGQAYEEYQRQVAMLIPLKTLKLSGSRPVKKRG